MEKKTKVLFLCTHNPARGGMAEGFLRHLAGDDFVIASAGVDGVPINPLAIEVMKEAGIDISTQHSKDTAEALKERFAFVVSMSNIGHERAPVFPFAFRILQWSIEDPEESDDPREEQLERFRRVRNQIEKNVREFLLIAKDELNTEPLRRRGKSASR
jgi:arsenate reductase (thioredoxin)